MPVDNWYLVPCACMRACLWWLVCVRAQKKIVDACAHSYTRIRSRLTYSPLEFLLKFFAARINIISIHTCVVWCTFISSFSITDIAEDRRDIRIKGHVESRLKMLFVLSHVSELIRKFQTKKKEVEITKTSKTKFLSDSKGMRLL